MGGRTGFTDGRDVAEAVPPPPKGILRDYAETILVCVIFVIFSRTFSFQQSKIPSGSMMDTLLVGDYIMVNRFVYAPTTFDWERKFLPIRDLQRGDIIVFKFPNEPEIDYIKRVVGVPGDTIEIRDGYLYRNGEKQPEPFVKEKYRGEMDPREGRSDPPMQQFPATVVQPGGYFAMGDHRCASRDSRYWGLVPRELLKGRALLIWWSYEETPEDGDRKGFDQLKSMASKLLHFVTRSRWSRSFSLIR